MVKICCEDMKENLYCTDQEYLLPIAHQNDNFIYYSSKFNEYGLPIYDGEKGRATSYLLIQYCPWCGKKLPKSRRDEWFACLESLGFDFPFEQFEEIPQKFKSSEWFCENSEVNSNL